jgi:hypothetical protein
MTSPIEAVLGRLDGVAKLGKGHKAQCPAHGDKTPSLSVKEGDDGRVLIHCFAGCLIEDITAAMGLSMSDLFSANESGRPSHRIPGFNVRALKEAAEFERQILFIVSADKKSGKSISQSDLERTKVALNRIAMARRVL